VDSYPWVIPFMSLPEQMGNTLMANPQAAALFVALGLCGAV